MGCTGACTSGADAVDVTRQPNHAYRDWRKALRPDDTSVPPRRGASAAIDGRPFIGRSDSPCMRAHAHGVRHRYAPVRCHIRGRHGHSAGARCLFRCLRSHYARARCHIYSLRSDYAPASSHILAPRSDYARTECHIHGLRSDIAALRSRYTVAKMLCAAPDCSYRSVATHIRPPGTQERLTPQRSACARSRGR